MKKQEFIEENNTEEEALSEQDDSSEELNDQNIRFNQVENDPYDRINPLHNAANAGVIFNNAIGEIVFNNPNVNAGAMFDIGNLNFYGNNGKAAFINIGGAVGGAIDLNNGNINFAPIQNEFIRNSIELIEENNLEVTVLDLSNQNFSKLDFFNIMNALPKNNQILSIDCRNNLIQENIIFSFCNSTEHNIVSVDFSGGPVTQMQNLPNPSIYKSPLLICNIGGTLGDSTDINRDGVINIFEKRLLNLSEDLEKLNFAVKTTAFFVENKLSVPYKELITFAKNINIKQIKKFLTNNDTTALGEKFIKAFKMIEKRVDENFFKLKGICKMFTPALENEELQLGDLPKEVLFKIFSYLNFDDITQIQTIKTGELESKEVMGGEDDHNDY